MYYAVFFAEYSNILVFLHAEMKKTLVLSIIIIGALIATTMFLGKPHHTGMRLGEPWSSLADRMSDSLQRQKPAEAPIPKEELISCMPEQVKY